MPKESDINKKMKAMHFREREMYKEKAMEILSAATIDIEKCLKKRF